MRSFHHWTPRYLINRFLEKRYRHNHPCEPWLTPAANLFLTGYLHQEDIGLEFGSGASTTWFARRVAHLTSVEHNEKWFIKITSEIKSMGIDNVCSLLIGVNDEKPEGGVEEYSRVIERFHQDSLDFVLVDGKLRDLCALGCLPKIRPGGILIVDNADVYLPSDVKTPNARRGGQGAASPIWEKFLLVVASWRSYWTCNGVTATAFFFKPYSKCCYQNEEVII